MARFRKGVSGNPGGRPKRLAREVIEPARAHTAEAIETLVRCMRSDDPKVALAAAQALLDRGWGKPPPSLDPSPPVLRTVLDLSDGELLAIAARGDD